MTDNNHPITPSPELVQQWARYQGFESPEVLWRTIATQAARWGADQELEACCKLLELSDSNARDFLYSARRPKPPSLKEQAIALLESVETSQDACSSWDFSVVRRALESLPD